MNFDGRFGVLDNGGDAIVAVCEVSLGLITLTDAFSFS